MVFFQVKGEEQVRLEVAGIEISLKVQVGLISSAPDFIICDLKQEFDGLPAIEQGLVPAEFPAAFSVVSCLCSWV